MTLEHRRDILKLNPGNEHTLNLTVSDLIAFGFTGKEIVNLMLVKFHKKNRESQALVKVAPEEKLYVDVIRELYE